MSATRAVVGFTGLGLMAYGVHGLVAAEGIPGRQALAAAVLVVGHEGIVMPLAIGVGWVALRVVPPWARAATQVALVVTLALTIVAIPLLALAGASPDLPSLLPRDYRRGLIIAVGVTWLIAAAITFGNRLRHPSAEDDG